MLLGDFCSFGDTLCVDIVGNTEFRGEEMIKVMSEEAQ